MILELPQPPPLKALAFQGFGTYAAVLDLVRWTHVPVRRWRLLGTLWPRETDLQNKWRMPTLECLRENSAPRA